MIEKFNIPIKFIKFVFGRSLFDGEQFLKPTFMNLFVREDRKSLVIASL
jgi:hypothetical protein